MIIDTHCHIFDSKFDEIREEVIQEALDMNVKKMIVVGYDYESSLKAIELANKYDFLYASIGLHPSEVLKENDKDLKWIYDLLKKSDKIVAIGEIGLDYYWDKSFIEEQKIYFKKQIEIAKETNLPIIVHTRDSIQDTFDILKNENVKGVLHCFSSSLEMAREFVKRGYYIGIGGVVTFKNSIEIKRIAEDINLDFILSETDCPYLAPVPFRGKINHPGYTKYVVEKIAELRNMNLVEVEEALENNAYKLFNIGE